MLLPSLKPSFSYLLLKFVYVTSQLRHSKVVHPFPALDEVKFLNRGVIVVKATFENFCA